MMGIAAGLRWIHWVLTLADIVPFIVHGPLFVKRFRPL